MSLERITDDPNTPWWGEHYQRYQYAFNFISGNEVVLDIACGQGFGTYAVYKKGVKKIIGVDLDEKSIDLCRSKYFESISPDFFQFIRMDATNLGFPDSSFDLVLSFETIEHIKDSRKVIQEYSRVLKKGGKLVLSTPNATISSPNGVIENPYHVREFDQKGLSELLSDFFVEYKIGGQNYVRYGPKPSIAKTIEQILYLRGIRRLDTKAKNFIMRFFGQPQFYPNTNDYEIVFDTSSASQSVTLIAICTK